MRAALAVLAAAELVSCGPPTAARATWSSADFLARAAEPALDFGGFGLVGGPGSPPSLVVLEGQPIPYRSFPFSRGTRLQAVGPGLPVQPAWAEGAPAGMVTTEVWDEGQPPPWLQPAYLAPGAVAGTIAQVVFPVGVEGSFYSPFWLAQLIGVPPGTPVADLPRSAEEVLDLGWPLTPFALVYCTLVPDGLTLAAAAGDPPGPAGGAALVHPFTGEVLGDAPAPGLAFVEDRPVSFLSLGTGSTPIDGQRLRPAILYTFFQEDPSGHRRVLPLPPVLPDAPRAHALVQRVDVPLPAGAAAFAPAELRAGLSATLDAPGFPEVPLALEVDPAIDAVSARRYLLRVALNPECFRVGGGFPGACQWLDSAARVEAAVPALARQPRAVYLAVDAAVGAR